jgi:hypothetical protein
VLGGDESRIEALAELANLAPFRDGQLGAEECRELSPRRLEMQLDLHADERSRPLSG